MSARRHKHWGWGFEDEQLDGEQLSAAAAGLVGHLGFGDAEPERPLALDDVTLAPARVAIPASLREICSSERHERASHALGKSYGDVVRGFRGRFEHPPDFVARPRNEVELERVIEWCAAGRVAVIPYGGGTSVVGGVEPRIGAAYNGSVSVDLRALDSVLAVDSVSRSALIQAGATGPRLEEQLAAHGLTLRHFPQSFEFSTLGGWIATRAAGHFATLWTHIEDMVESVRALTPTGAWQSRRLPGSGAGVSPDRMLVGSEGTLGVITQAWMRVQPRPTHRAGCAVRFDRFEAGAQCVRALSQAGLHPANCRLIDALEARLTMAGDGSAALLVLGFESSDHSVAPSMRRALQLCAEHGGTAPPGAGDEGGGGAATGARRGGADGSVDGWRAAFLRAPYLRDVMVAVGVLSETFESSITWERFEHFHETVMQTAGDAVREVTGRPVGPEPGCAHLSCRLTHVYPDGPAPYYTIVAPARRGEELEQWAQIKAAVSDAVMAAGGTITHHHAVGRDHRPWYDLQRPAPFAAALRAAKSAVDPHAILNPGVLVDPA